MSAWKTTALRLLGDPSAPRVFGREELIDYFAQHNLDIPLRTLLRGLREWESAQLVERIAQGVYLNAQHKFPVVTPAEAAHFLRKDAVLSLHYVLGNAGVLNNPSHWITCVLPSSNNKAVTEVEMDNGLVFRFAYVQDEFFNTQLKRDALQQYAQVPTATPEKALLDLLYLVASPRGSKRWSLPPVHDWDMDCLDHERLDRLAQQLNMEEPLRVFKDSLDNGSPRVRVARRVF